MKAILLAAGRGARLGKYTENSPKGMLTIANRTLIEIQINCLRRAGINDIIIVKGYKGESIKYNGIKYYYNDNFDNTNMVVSLMKATAEFNDDIVICYSDIIYDQSLLENIIANQSDAVVLVDDSWKKYWMMRYGNIHSDLESLIINDNHEIIQIGLADVPSELMMSRYIGLLKFSRHCLNKIINIVAGAEKDYKDRPWKLSGKPYPQAYMTDLIQALIDMGVNVRALASDNGWLEFDTEEDYEKALCWISNGEINALFHNFNALIK